jgi:hypothetical protein
MVKKAVKFSRIKPAKKFCWVELRHHSDNTSGPVLPSTLARLHNCLPPDTFGGLKQITIRAVPGFH